MEPRISTLKIERFRALRHIEIAGLGRVNLITGRNNTGKSSVLEALRILASDASPVVINSILDFREEESEDLESPPADLDIEDSFPWSSLFSGFPGFSTKSDPIVIASEGREQTTRLSLGMVGYDEERNPEGGIKRVPRPRDFFSEDDGLPALAATTNGRERLLPLDSLRGAQRTRRLWAESADEGVLPCMFVSAYGGERTTSLAPLWDRIALSDHEEDVVEALRIIEPRISAVSMVGGGGSQQRGTRIAIVRSEGLPRAVPLRSFGDGMNRLFGIALSLVNAKGGLLLIDEFENGLHHTVQAGVWRAIFKLASRLDVQVVATSHSWDAVEAFQEVASESAEEGVLIRLARKGEDVIPTVLNKAELAVAARDRIEVR